MLNEEQIADAVFLALTRFVLWIIAWCLFWGLIAGFVWAGWLVFTDHYSISFEG